MTKTCKDCGETKPHDEFHNDKKAKDGKRLYCKPCHNARSRAWEKANPERKAERNRRSHLKRYYGIDPEQFDEMMAKQRGCCAVCGTTEPGGHGNFHVDHSHETGEVRGLLCHNCNRAIGMLGDNLDGVMNAVFYLVRAEGLVTEEVTV